MDITKKFENLDNDKQQRIINAALKEFAENGYEKASTNRIVKSAGIGKGMLFYYFKNKKALYHYLTDYTLDIVKNEYLTLIDTTEPDFIERMKQAARVKTKARSDNPDTFNFLGTLLLTSEGEVSADQLKKIQELQKLGNSKIYDNINNTLFRDDIDVDKAFKLVRWSIEGYQNEISAQLAGRKMSSINLDPYWDEFYEYLDILKTSFYK
ncbi:TetR/AcrR family transcriptional regulator [Virgibacillus salinus]|uniref:Transcriptional regulator, TetR family n=1 Tax=Virgibacillus salinus TaxID=553311 RepID=A0A1H1FM94_9BACI|nr:transcriptional regulator, TetR family [Virgibacillus salinus]